MQHLLFESLNRRLTLRHLDVAYPSQRFDTRPVSNALTTGSHGLCTFFAIHYIAADGLTILTLSSN